MTTTDKPSIAELQGAAECVAEGCRTDAQERILAAAPVLLEIAQAGKALTGPSRPSDAHLPEWNALLAALSKVRP